MQIRRVVRSLRSTDDNLCPAFLAHIQLDTLRFDNYFEHKGAYKKQGKKQSPLSQKPRGDNGFIGERGRKSPDDLDWASLSLLMVNVVEIVELVSVVSASGTAFFLSRDFGSPPLALRFEFLLLSDEETLRSSIASALTLSFALPFPRGSPYGSGSVLGGGESKRAYSSSMNSASFLQPFQQSRQSQTRNLKQKASIFIHGWKQMHKFRKSILFLSECARRRLK